MQQPTLEGLPPAPTAAAPSAAPSAHPTTADLLAQGGIRLAITGRLVADAVLRDTSRGNVVIEAVVHQHLAHHPGAAPVFAKWLVPDYGSYAVTRAYAERKAAALLAGASVVVTGVGLEPGTHQGRPVLRVVRVIALATFDDSAQQPQAAAPQQPALELQHHAH